MKKPTKPACEMCRFWETDEPPTPGPRTGPCHRYPPSEHRKVTSETFEWDLACFSVTTFNDDWCGEFKERKKP